ncbi:MAG: uroporphyrinogen-III synthase [Stellaceae bacterium]
MTGPLAGRRIALPEHRELDRLARMLEAEGAEAVRCPLVAIRDALDPAPVAAWVGRFIAAPPDDLILLTGEGLRRLAAAARRVGSEAAFVAALGRVRTLSRGPKPVRVLRELGLGEGLRAVDPTTEGVIATLSGEDLRGRRVAVQLYPDNPNAKLVEFLRAAGAEPDPVVPYAYTSDADERRIGEMIGELAAGRIDAIAFTSSPQVARLVDVAKAAGREAELIAALRRIAVAAIGPITAAALAKRGVTAVVGPTGRYFMKPLVTAMVAALRRDAAG